MGGAAAACTSRSSIYISHKTYSSCRSASWDVLCTVLLSGAQMRCKYTVQGRAFSLIQHDAVCAHRYATASLASLWGQLTGSSMKPSLADPPAMTTPGLTWKATVRLLPFWTEKLVLPAERITLLGHLNGCVWTGCQSARRIAILQRSFW